MADVLVVDDGLEVQDWVGWLLKRKRLPFRLAQDGQQALRLAAEQWPGVVLLDVQLAGALDGWQVWDALLSMYDGRALRVIVLAGTLTEGDEDQAHSRAAWAILRKPVSHERLLTCLRGALAGAAPDG